MPARILKAMLRPSDHCLENEGINVLETKEQFVMRWLQGVADCSHVADAVSMKLIKQIITFADKRYGKTVYRVEPTVTLDDERSEETG